jgi:hypothetical protein
LTEDREQFRSEYRSWILLMARDAAYRLAVIPPHERARIVEAYRTFKDPSRVFQPLKDPERAERLAGDRISGYIMLETDAVAFFPSMYASASGAVDFAVATNRRFYFRGKWYPIISLNSEYISQSNDRLLTFALEHELEMSRIFQDISQELRMLSVDEKREITESAEQISRDRIQITPEELIQDEKLMHRLSLSQPLIPKSYAERAMLLYLENNQEELEAYGLPSRNPEEQAFGEELYEEFSSWSEFSQTTYELFVREIFSLLRDSNRGYS